VLYKHWTGFHLSNTAFFSHQSRSSTCWFSTGPECRRAVLCKLPSGMEGLMSLRFFISMGLMQMSDLFSSGKLWVKSGETLSSAWISSSRHS
jgi:hypothetical protein